MVQYTSQQLKIGEFGNLYQMKLDPCNRWIQLAAHFPWGECAKIYGTNANRNRCRERGIRMTVAPKGKRPPGDRLSKKEFNERNQIEGRFGRAKQGYGLNNIKAKLSNTSHFWKRAILFVTDLVKFAEPDNFRFRLSGETLVIGDSSLQLKGGGSFADGGIAPQTSSQGPWPICLLFMIALAGLRFDLPGSKATAPLDLKRGAE